MKKYIVNVNIEVVAKNQKEAKELVIEQLNKSDPCTCQENCQRFVKSLIEQYSELTKIQTIKKIPWNTPKNK